jgi:hypothetical protein
VWDWWKRNACGNFIALRHRAMARWDAIPCSRQPEAEASEQRFVANSSLAFRVTIRVNEQLFSGPALGIS